MVVENVEPNDIKSVADAVYRRQTHRSLPKSLLLPSIKLDSKHRVCNVPELCRCALCTWTIYFKSTINKNNYLHICTVASYMYLKVGWK